MTTIVDTKVAGFEWDGVGWMKRAADTGLLRLMPMAYDVACGTVVAFGGGMVASGVTLASDETWTYNGDAWTRAERRGDVFCAGLVQAHVDLL